MNTNLRRLSGWSKFLGWFYFATGVLSCITIVGVVTGVVLILMGRNLINGAKLAEAVDSQGVIYNNELNEMIAEYKNFFMIHGILMIVSFVLIVGYMLIFGFALTSAFSQLRYMV